MKKQELKYDAYKNKRIVMKSSPKNGRVHNIKRFTTYTSSPKMEEFRLKVRTDTDESSELLADVNRTETKIITKLKEDESI